MHHNVITIFFVNRNILKLSWIWIYSVVGSSNIMPRDEAKPVVFPIDGHIYYAPSLTDKLTKEIERIKQEYPVCDVRISLSNIHDKRYSEWIEKESK
jgi:hypothetical protein